MAKGYDIVGASGGVRSPGFVLAEMRTVDATIKSLGIDIQRKASQLPEGFMDEWIAFRVEWDLFYNDNDGWLDRATNSVYDKTLEFRERVVSWRDQFIRVGGTPSAPPLPKESKLPITALLVGFGIVGAGLWYIFKVDHES